MSILQRASKPEREPIVATIVGTAGSGKTSLASTFPDAILVRTQGEALPRDIATPPDSLPELQTADDLWEILKALLNDEHNYKTLILDSVTGLDSLFTADVLDQEAKNGGKARGIIQALGGYGAGPAAVQASHMRVRKAVEFLRKRRGMHTVFVGHADIADVSPPDGDPFSHYTLRLPKKSIAPYTDAVDLVGFLKQDRIVRGATEAKPDRAAKPGRAITTGDRVLVTYLQPASLSKNRFGIEEDISVQKGVNPLAFLLDEPKTPKKAKAAPVADDEIPDTHDFVEGEAK